MSFENRQIILFNNFKHQHFYTHTLAWIKQESVSYEVANFNILHDITQ
jgi:hypothetical protein